MKKHLLFIGLFLTLSHQLLAQTILGIDVSHYQGSINWTQVAASGKVFAWVKSTEGVTYNDPNYTTYMSGGTSAGVVMGVYHFARPESNTAVDEANHFLAMSSSSIGVGFLPPALDLEDPPTGPALTSYFTSAALTAWAQTWLTTVQNATGITPVIYTSASIAAYLNSSLNTYGLWIANPGTSSTTPPANIGVWNTWMFKQYSWTGTVSGITGSVDLNVYNGTTTDFNILIGTAPCTAPANDNCPGISITSNGNCLTGTVSCATGSYGANQCTGCTCTSPDDKDVYYSFTAAATSETVTLSNYAANFDAVMELRTACAFNTALGCYDPVGSPTSVSNTWNNLTIGNTYYIRVFEYNYSGSIPTSPTFDICVTHTVCSPPTNISFSGTLAACSSGTTAVSVSAFNCTGCAFQWSGGLGSGSSKNLSPGSYTVTATSNCGGSASATVSISTLSAPNAPIISTAGTCNPVSVSANSIGCSSCAYSWNTPVGINSGATISGIATGTYSVTVTDANTCTAGNSQSVTVNQIPTATISPASISICNGASTTLTASGGGTYAWSTNEITSAISVSPSTNISYTVTVSLNNCTATATANVTIYNTPIANAGADQTNTGAGVTIGGNPTAGGGQIPYTYSWNPISTLDSSAVANPFSNAVDTTTYTVVVTDNNNCTASDSVIISPIACAYQLSASIIIADSSGLVSSVSVLCPAFCNWNVNSGNCSWLTVLPASGVGTDSFVVSISATNDTFTKQCTLIVEGDSITITQYGKAGALPCAAVDTSVQVNGGCDLAAASIAGATYQWYRNGTAIPFATSQYYTANQNGYYRVGIAVGGCVYQSSDHYLTCFTAIEESSISNLNVYPNPTEGTFVLSGEAKNAKQLLVTLYNALGQIVYSKNILLKGETISEEIKVKNLAAGIYNLQLLIDKQAYNKKLVVR
ncbi:MAG: GH25 family lysozyme [Bacteroidetes bacterium]|nr:GH25 family lysozyme [Bacteroidota bacterium]